MNTNKIGEERIFEIVHCPFDGWAELRQYNQPKGPTGQCKLGDNSKGQCTISKIFFSLILSTFKEQNIFFLETYASTISEPKFTVWLGRKTPVYTLHEKSSS